MYFLTIYKLVMLPFVYCWEFEVDEYVWVMIPFLMHSIDMLLNLNTSFYLEGLLIDKKKEIIKNYLKFELQNDILIIFALLMAYQTGQNEFHAAYFLKFNFISEIVNETDERLRIYQRFPAVWTLGKLILQILFTAHYCGSIFYYLAIY